MASVLQQYHQLADRMATQITSSYQSWTDFLTTAARLYKYPYHEQLMIYAQRPDATACAEYDLWNKRMGRYIRQGAKGIALIDHSGDAPRLRYVFDVADTRGTARSRSPYLWEFRPEHERVVSHALEQQYSIRYAGDFADQLEQICSVKVTEYFLAHEQDILGIVDGSYLEQYHNYDKGVAFLNAAAVSTTYMLLSRCGLAENAHFGPEDFMPVFDFNTPQTVDALGSAISGISEEILRNIEVTIKKYEREKATSKSDYVVANRDGDPLSYTQFKRIWKYIETRTVKERSYVRYENGKKEVHTVTPVLGQKAVHNGNVVYSLDFHVTPHQLRHTYITNLIYASVDPKTVQYLAGHENSKITMDIYAKVKYNRPEQLASVINTAFASREKAPQKATG